MQKAVVRGFSMNAEDFWVLWALQDETGLNASQIVRQALREMAEKKQLKAPTLLKASIQRKSRENET